MRWNEVQNLGVLSEQVAQQGTCLSNVLMTNISAVVGWRDTEETTVG